jgi:hypothetical protein
MASLARYAPQLPPSILTYTPVIGGQLAQVSPHWSAGSSC